MRIRRKRKHAKLATQRIRKIFRDERRLSALFKKELRMLKTATSKSEITPKVASSNEESPNKTSDGKMIEKKAAAKRKKAKAVKKVGKDSKKRVLKPKKYNGLKQKIRKIISLVNKDTGQETKLLNHNSKKGIPAKADVNVSCTACLKPIFHSSHSLAKGVCKCRGVKRATFGAFWQASVPGTNKIKTTVVYRVNDRTLHSTTKTDRGKASSINMVLTMAHGSFVFGY